MVNLLVGRLDILPIICFYWYACQVFVNFKEVCDFFKKCCEMSSMSC